ncbi:hypothetical protein GCM10023340_20220 [Nocardioides marinquilinus]|uniref:Spore protein YkvP/CgeB glycosyl transferase-like domain-containing protein n=1 Tax=Nocardioides marinquilinus TaxID=1210400 RepID=A0ABP9PKD7_9ACTN
MRAAVIGPTAPDLFADNVASSLRAMGHEATLVGPARRDLRPARISHVLHLAADQVSALDRPLQRAMLRRVAETAPDVVISVDNRLTPETVREMRRSVGKIVLWFPDAVSNFRKHQMFLAPYDRIYLKIPSVARKLQAIYGLPVRYLPEAANPLWHRPAGPYGVEPSFAVVGNIHPTRAVLLDALLRDGVPLRLYGSPIADWMEFPRLREAHAGRSVFGQEKARVFRSSRGVINNLHPAEFAGSNCRLFEATASGAAVLTEWLPGMDELFERGREVLTFDSYDELVEVCNRLLRDTVDGVAIADAAASRASLEHTYAHRLRTMFEDLGI